MNSRSLIGGAVFGALIGFATGWILASGNNETVTIQAGPEPGAATAPKQRTVELVAPEQTETDTRAGNDGAPGTPTGRRSLVDDEAVPWPANQWQKLELEPKDDSWAYYMEQTLRQFLGDHPSAGQFDISRIECRTTTCQLEVVGYDASTQPVWQQVLYDIRHQPWSDFAHYGSSSGNVDGNFVLIGTFWRLSTEQ